MVVPTLTLNNGLQVPAFGLGTFKSSANDVTQAVLDAIDAGYRHFDTAYFYDNEGEVAKAIQQKIDAGVVKREDIFFVTKLWNTFHKTEHVERIFRHTLAQTGFDYIDLYLIHFPTSFVYRSDDELLPTKANGLMDVDNTVDIVQTWRELEKLVKLGLIKSIGVSNFNSVQIKLILDAAEIKPVINQVECSPALNQKELTKFCKEHDILITAYSPLGRPNLELKTPSYLFDEKIAAIGAKHNKTPAQIVLRYLFELGTIPIPKSVTKSRIIENIDIFDFALTKDDLEVMDGYHTGERVVLLEPAIESKNYPFSIPY